MISTQEFIEKWRRAELSESSASREHFLDLCDLLEVDRPAKADPTGKSFTFEKSVKKPDGRAGRADVWKKGCFAWEYKGKQTSLIKAYSQLKEYADALDNPPLLIVSDMKEIRIHTNFTNSVVQTYVIGLADLRSPEKVKLLRWAFEHPEYLRPNKTRESVTADAARALAGIAQGLHQRQYEPRRVAHFLNKLVFSMFVEDENIGLLPDRLFAEVVEEALKQPDSYMADTLRELFAAMRSDKGRFGKTPIPWFNGGLFDDDDVLPLGFEQVRRLADATRLDWSAIQPSIFGTLFEQGLDPARRKEMANLFDAGEDAAMGPSALLPFEERARDKGVGIHYTDPETIMKIVEPVVLRPLRAEWQAVKEELSKLKGKAREIRYLAFRKRLGDVRVLDPACGSGNFLYLALRHLKDFDLAVSQEADAMGLPDDKERVTPEVVMGIEANPYAAELARVTIWIGEIQWQIQNGFKIKRRPILGVLKRIENRDALLASGSWEAPWPDAELIIGNPPFLGNKRMIGALGEDYVTRLRQAFEGRVSANADLVVYWFEKARAMMEAGRVRRVGLVSTNSIRSKANRGALDRIRSSGVIFEAWSDEPWVIDGAAVRVSLVCYAAPSDPAAAAPSLDGKPVSEIYSDLTGQDINGEHGVDLTQARRLRENFGCAFQGPVKVGPFDITGDLARKFLTMPQNPNGRPNADVVCLWVNGMDITRRPSDKWIIDFGEEPEADAALYEAPFEYVRKVVKPERDKNRRDRRRIKWWQHGETVPGLRKALANVSRFIATPRVAKHRLFVWLPNFVVPDSRLIAITRDDDTTFGIVHSRFHEAWSLRLGGWHGVGNDPQYTPTLGFETFPFPEGLTPDIPAKGYATDKRAKRITAAAARLNELREAWLNPPDLVERRPEVVPGFPGILVPRGPRAEKELKRRTLTNLYNERPQWLLDAHRALDEAVAAAYGWNADISEDDALAALLALNQERAAES